MLKQCTPSHMPFHTKEIWIHDKSFVSDIQTAFSGCYPFLRIDFLETTAASHTLKSSNIDPHTSLRALASLPEIIRMDINRNRTVSEITHDFGHALGVIAQVSRKSGNVWNTISVTEGWTLENQNTAGEYISSQMLGIVN